MKFSRQILLALLLLLPGGVVLSQENAVSPIDSLSAQLKKVQADISNMRRTRISGFIQAQYQVAQTPGIETMAGGNFAPNSDSRFSVRRGRLRLDHASNFGSYGLHIDVSERGVRIVDAFATFDVPRTESLSLTAGLFMRPFSHEIMDSDARRESLERARVTQMLFPTERDLGAKLTWSPTEESGWDFLTVEAGLFNGTGANASEFDSFKDFIGNVAINQASSDGSIRYGFRVSGHLGGFRQSNQNVWTMGTLPGGAQGFVLNNDAANNGAKAEQNLISVDAQVSLRSGMGTTTVQGEYIGGQQPGFLGSTRAPATAPAVTADTYIRDIQGAIFKIFHRIEGTNFTAVFKYDWFDPNTQVSGNEIGEAGNALTATEIAYSNMGFGWLWDVDRNMRLTAYYDIPVNETSVNLPGFASDIQDNVFTLRLLYRF